MNDHRLTGVRADAILGYLKAVGILRLIAQQADPAVRGGWEGATFVLRTVLDRTELEAFFLDRYRPSPVFNPWNSGAGFDAKSAVQKAGQTLAAVAATTDERWTRPRDVLALARRIVDELGESSSREAKTRILRVLRERYPDDALPWLDAAVVIGGDNPQFPSLLGTGGNDGRLDFSVNFLQRALDVIGPRPLPERSALLADALNGTSSARLASDVAIGQYAPGSAGGVNATTGFDAVSLVNPWDFVLLIEGLVVFSGSLVKRFGSGTTRAAFPFTFASTIGGFGSASSTEDTRGEVWLPRWRGLATFRSIAMMIRTARVDVETTTDSHLPSARPAQTAVEAAEAALSRGLTNGIDGFDRIIIAQRNGLSFAATRVGYVRVLDSPLTAAAAALSREASRWLKRLRGKDLGAAARAALRAYDEAVFAFAQQRATAVGLQEWLAALGRLDAALGLAPPENVVPFRFRDADVPARIAAALDDHSDEHALAAAWSSVACRTEEWIIRFDLAPVARRGRDYVYATNRDRQAHLTDALADACARRAREAHQRESRAPLNGLATSGVSTATLARWLDGEHGTTSVARIERLLTGYVLLSPSAPATSQAAIPGDRDAAATLSVAWCAVKLLFDGLPEFAQPLDPDVPNLVRVGRARTREALQRTYRSAAIARNTVRLLADRPLRDIRRAELPDPARACAALLLPLTPSARNDVRERALQPERAFQSRK